LDLIAIGFSTLFEPAVLLMLVAGLFAGLIVGSIPGINDNIAFAVFIPFSFAMPAAQALALMVGVYCAAASGGAIPAIMLKVPGTASALLTAVDGNAMARKNQAGKALSIALTSSVVGGTVCSFVLLLFAPILAKLALLFGFVETFALTVLGLSSVVGLLAGNVLRGLASAFIGLLVSTVGFSLTTGYPRYTFDNVNLIEGVPFVPLLVGLFGVASIFELVADIVRERRESGGAQALPGIGSMRLSRALFRRLLPVWATNLIGMLPGAGMLMAIYLSYDQAARRFRRKFARLPDEPKWGEGAPEGIAAPESANNAVTASSMVPLLSLGIPGNSTSALFIGALGVQGMVPGPLLFSQNADIAWMIIVAFLVANLLMWPIAFVVIKSVSRTVFAIRKEVLVGVIALLCMLGAYADGANSFNIWVALIAGFVAYLMKLAGMPLGPAILGLVLGGQMESALSNSLSVSGGSWLIFVDVRNHPISAVMIAIAMLMWAIPMLRYLKERAAR
jgi:putative tricarboxylic transport membrane protein